MRFLVTFLLNRMVALLALSLVLNAYLRMAGIRPDVGLKDQIETVRQNFQILADAFR